MDLNGKNILDGLSIVLTNSSNHLLGAIFGPGVEKTVFGNVSRADVITMLCFLLFVLIVNFLVAFMLRRMIRSTRETEGSVLQPHLLKALRKPLYVLLWICGIYFAVTPLLFTLKTDEGLHIIRDFFNKVFNIGVFSVIFWLFFRFTHVLETRLAYWASKTSSKLDDLFVPLLGRSLRIILPVVGVIFAMPLLGLPAEYSGILAKASSILLVAAIATILFQAVGIVEKAILTRYDITVSDNLKARTVYTQVHVVGKVLYSLICLFAIACVLMMFEEVRRFGTSILASAGVVGIIIGFAAQKTIANLFAGFQIALTQPIRLDDVVVVEGEWGRVEEISLTYVIIHIWDDRRLVVPLSQFIEKPFQNWTRSSAEIMGSVFLWVDYSLPIDEIRIALKGIIENNPLWDKRFWNLQVTDATERTMQIRVLATSADSSKSWDLRCDIREKLIFHIQNKYPQSLPQIRTLSGSMSFPE